MKQLVTFNIVRFVSLRDWRYGRIDSILKMLINASQHRKS